MCEEWSSHSRLQFFMVSSFSESITLVYVHWLQQWQMMTMTKSKVQLGSEACILLQSTCTTTYSIKSSHLWNSRFDRINKPLVQAKIRENNFHGWGKIHKNSKIYCPQKFPTIRYIQIFISMKVVCIWQSTCTYQYYMISESTVFVNFNVHMNCISLACKGGGKGGAMVLKLHIDWISWGLAPPQLYSTIYNILKFLLAMNVLPMITSCFIIRALK